MLRASTPWRRCARSDNLPTRPSPPAHGVLQSLHRPYASVRCDPSQKAPFLECLHPHHATLPALVKSTFRGARPDPRWEPSQNGCVADFPQAHHQYEATSAGCTYGARWAIFGSSIGAPNLIPAPHPRNWPTPTGVDRNAVVRTDRDPDQRRPEHRPLPRKASDSIDRRDDRRQHTHLPYSQKRLPHDLNLA